MLRHFIHLRSFVVNKGSMRNPLIIYLSTLFILSLCINMYLMTYTAKSPLQGDQVSYELIGREIASGKSSGSSYQAPLYQHFIAAVYLIFGPKMIYVRVIQCILSSLSVLLIYWLASRAFGLKTALISSVLATFSLDLVFYSGLLLPENLFVFLVLVGLVCFTYVLQEGLAPNARFDILVGFVFGLGALVKSQFVLFPPILMVWKLVVGKGKRIEIFRVFVIIGFIMFLTIAPWTVRNYLVHGEFIFITTNGGEVFWQGNNPDATGGDISHLPQFKDHPMVKMDPVESNKIGYKLGFQWIKQHPISFLGLCLKKLGMYWTFIRDWQYDELWGSYLGKAASDLLPTIDNAILIFAGIFGFLYTFSPKSHWFALHLLVIYFSVIHMIFLSGVRYRVGILPIVIIFAARGIIFFYSLYKKRGEARLELREWMTVCFGIILSICVSLATVYDVYLKFGAANLQFSLDKIIEILFH